MPTLRAILNNGNPNSTDPAMQQVQLGEALALVPRTIRAAVANNKVVLPEYAKAALILRCYGMGTSSGWLTALATGTVGPTAGQCGINAQGDIVVASADGLTTVLLTYLALEGGAVIYQEQVAVATNVATLLGGRRAALLLTVNADAGTALGAKTPVHRPATPTAGQVAIGAADDTTVVFASADAVTLATIRYIAFPGVGNAPLGVGIGLDTISLGAS